jgi:hypothetical protein
VPKDKKADVDVMEKGIRPPHSRTGNGKAADAHAEIPNQPYEHVVEGVFLGMINPISMRLDEVRRGEADESALGPDHGYDKSSDKLILRGEYDVLNDHL